MRLIAASSPHIRGNNTTRRIMVNVVLALLPAAAVGVLVHGLRALMIILISIASALLGEFLWSRIVYKRSTMQDYSAVVTGLLLAMTLPVTVPYWLAASGSIFAVVVIKGFCGGIAGNPFNPALAARAFMLLMFPLYMTRYPALNGTMGLLDSAADVISSATPLHQMQLATLPSTSLWSMFLGNIGGSIGEVSKLALLAGGIFLIGRKVISARIPLAYLGSVAVFAFIFCDSEQPLLYMLYNLLGGGAVLAAFFMATDYSSSPVTPVGQLIYGVGCGALTVFFRNTGLFPEGVTYAVLLMNAAVWLIDEKTAPRRFGSRKEKA